MAFPSVDPPADAPPRSLGRWLLLFHVPAITALGVLLACVVARACGADGTRLFENGIVAIVLFPSLVLLVLFSACTEFCRQWGPRHVPLRAFALWSLLVATNSVLVVATIVGLVAATKPAITIQ